MVARQARSLLDSNASKNSSQVAHKKGSGNSKCQVFSSFGFKAKIKPSTLSSKPESASGQRRILSSFTLSKDSRVAASVDDWDMPPPAPRNRLVSQSAPASPTDCFTGSPNQEMQRISCSVSPVPLLRKKRSESLGSDLIAGGERGVTFAPRPEFLDDDRVDSLVAVELVSLASSEPTHDSGAPRRLRSASCHVLSSSSSADATCGTIYEEIGPASSCMDE